MRYRRFGKTNLNLSVFSLGTMRCLANQAQLQDTVHRAIALGINHIETARGYGNSEQYLASALQGIPREQFYITTKICPTPDAEVMRRSIEESLARLQLDYIDCLAIHGINTWEHLESVISPSGCLAAVENAIARGQIRHLGFSTHGSLDLIEAAINTHLFEFVNLHYYYFWQRHQSAIALANQLDLGVFIISPADKGGQLYTPPPKLEDLCAPLSPLDLNYRFLLSDSRIHTLSVGPANPQELNAIAPVVDQDHPLTSQELAIISQLQQELRETLGNDLCSQCYQCLPCPEDINIPEILRLRNLAIAYNMDQFGQYRYQMLENAGHWFPGRKGSHCTDCGDCLPRCPQNLNIPQLLRDAHQRLNGLPRRRLWG